MSRLATTPRLMPIADAALRRLRRIDRPDDDARTVRVCVWCTPLLPGEGAALEAAGLLVTGGICTAHHLSLRHRLAEDRAIPPTPPAPPSTHYAGGVE